MLEGPASSLDGRARSVEGFSRAGTGLGLSRALAGWGGVTGKGVCLGCCWRAEEEPREALGEGRGRGGYELLLTGRDHGWRWLLPTGDHSAT